MDEYSDIGPDDTCPDYTLSADRRRRPSLTERKPGLNGKFAKGALIALPVSLFLWFLILRLLHIV